MSCFFARPKAAGEFPAIVVVMEAFGLNRHIQNVAERIAREGYSAFAPDMYYREPGAVVGYENLPEAIRLMSDLTDDVIRADMDGLLAEVRRQDSVDAARVGVMGFCMGGRITFLTACRNAAIKAAVPFYGGGIGSASAGKAPLDYADQLSCPVLLFFGEDDPFIPLDEVEKIKNTLTRLRKSAEVIVYPGAPHGFFCEERDSYRPEAAADAWQRLLAFFATHLKA